MPAWMLNCSMCTIRGGSAHRRVLEIGLTFSGGRTVGLRGDRVVPPWVDATPDGVVGDSEENWSGRPASAVGSTPNAQADAAATAATAQTAATVTHTTREGGTRVGSWSFDTPQGCPTAPSRARS